MFFALYHDSNEPVIDTYCVRDVGQSGFFEEKVEISISKTWEKLVPPEIVFFQCSPILGQVKELVWGNSKRHRV